MKIASAIFPDIKDGPIYNPAGGKYGEQGKGGNIILTDIIANLITTALAIASILLLVYLVWGGIEWLTSGGEKQGIENAKNKITNAFIGLIIVALSIAIIIFIENFLGISILKLKLPTPSI